MRGNHLLKFNNYYNKILNESIRGSFYNKFKEVNLISNRKNPSIDDIKNELLKLTGFVDWKEFIDEQRSGDCDLIAGAVSKMFPAMKMFSVVITFSEHAKEQMEPQTDPKMFTCSHFLNKLNGKYIDFAKATNRYEEVYVLDGIDDIMSCEYSKEALQNIEEIQEEDPKAIFVNIY